MGRRFTLDEYLKAFADEEGVSVPDAISLHVTDAEVHSLGLFFIRFMGGLIHCLRTPPKRRARRRSMRGTEEQESHKETIDDLAEEQTTNNEDLIH
jgi:hypothetical protein